jgi:chitin synthase
MDSGMFHQPGALRPGTNYLDMPIPSSHSPESFDGISPSDAELERAIQDIIRAADLNTVTKRGIRRQLEEQFGVDLTARKNTINAAIDKILLANA